MTDESKVIKSYVLNDESLGILEKVSKDLGFKSRSETLRYIIKEFENGKRTSSTTRKTNLP